jgi:hypothetical protein
VVASPCERYRPLCKASLPPCAAVAIARTRSQGQCGGSCDRDSGRLQGVPPP